MIGLDTNILVRLLVEDDPLQTARAKHFVARHCTPDSPGFINCVVLAEFVWVLSSTYQFGRGEIASAIETLLAGRDRVIEYREEIQDALVEYNTTSIGFTDAMIARITPRAAARGPRRLIVRRPGERALYEYLDAHPLFASFVEAAVEQSRLV